MRQSLVHRIAESLVSGRHEPDHPSYKAFVSETVAQYRELVSGGLRVRFVDGTITGTSRELLADLDAGEVRIARGGNPLEVGHPLAVPVLGMTVNTMFRTVHDVLGHYQTRVPFETFDGEMLAYQNHRVRYSDEAQAALFGETVGQLCHYWSGRGFVPVQRAVILPREIQI